MNKNAAIINILEGNNEAEIIKTISKLRNTGTPDIISHVLQLLLLQKSEEVKLSVIQFLNDIKDKNCITSLVDIILDKKYKNHLDKIVSSCWQSGLDYSKFLSVFTDLIINESYAVAIESFTVIENMEGPFTKKELGSNIKKIKSALSENDKKYLLIELEKVLTSKLTD